MFKVGDKVRFVADAYCCDCDCICDMHTSRGYCDCPPHHMYKHQNPIGTVVEVETTHRHWPGPTIVDYRVDFPDFPHLDGTVWWTVEEHELVLEVPQNDGDSPGDVQERREEA